MVDRVAINYNNKFVDESGYPSQEIRLQILKVQERTYILGEGSPEGQVDAPRGSTYKDLNGTTGSITYFKSQAEIMGDGSRGWILE